MKNIQNEFAIQKFPCNIKIIISKIPPVNPIVQRAEHLYIMQCTNDTSFLKCIFKNIVKSKFVVQFSTFAD